MAYTTIDDPSAHFQIATWTGNGSSGTAVTNDGNSNLQPDLLWGKIRTDNADQNRNHWLIDSTRGINKAVGANTTTSEETNSGYLNSFDSDGFTLGNDGNSNDSGDLVVGWQWKANGGTTSSNNDGSYTTTVQANTTAGFSIVKYGDATSFSASTPATIGHGLGKTPSWILIKNLDGTRSWGVHHVSNGAGKIMYLDLQNAVASSTGFDNGTLPSSTVFTVNTLNVANGNNLEYIAYCWAPIQGYSKFSSYTGNANADGPFVYTGFKPAWLMIRNTIDGEDWLMWDIKRDKAREFGNPMSGRLKANDAIQEVAGDDIDFLSNGFKIRTDSTYANGSGNTIIYMAFAEHPFVSSKGVPTTAR